MSDFTNEQMLLSMTAVILSKKAVLNKGGHLLASIGSGLFVSGDEDKN